ncbi:hypothetical protein ABB29_02045 [Pseudoxanthomonas dokdonensis]|uniref:Dicarboxylate transport domain-containing protein n=1 Tax=Pseudoxanthomonas dokdonensis TaxID=344882 RepID=A0A0R0CPQ6_9GAMM|nr:hypothetical protein ABB29_02045 [Pseudoxanthomonas dokdonensis]
MLAYAGYLLVGNVFLNTGIGEWVVNRKPDRFQLQWSHGYTLWPLRMHLRDASAIGHYKRVRWQVNAGRAEGTLSALALFKKQIRISELSASDVDATVARGATSMDPAPPAANAWAVVMDAVQASGVRRVQAGDWLLTGKGTLRGGFDKHFRGGAMAIAPSQLTLSGVTLQHKGQVVLDDGELDLQMSMARTRTSALPGMRKLEPISGRLKLRGTTPAVKAVALADAPPRLSTGTGHGQLRLDVGLDGAVLRPGSLLSLNVPWQLTDTLGGTHRNTLLVDARVDRQLQFTARLPRSAEAELYLDADMRIASNRLPLDGQWQALLPLASGKLQGSWQFVSLRWLDEMFVAAPWISLDGAGRVDADLQLRDGKPVAGSRVDVPDIGVQALVMGNRINGRAQAHVTLERAADDTPVTRMEVSMKDYAMQAGSQPDSPVYARGNNMRMSVLVGGKVRDFRDNFQARLQFTDARVPALSIYNRYLPQQQLRFVDGAGKVSADVSLDGSGGIGSGWLRVAGSQTALEVAGLRMRADIDLTTRLQRADLKQRSFVLDGTRMSIKRAAFSEAGGQRHQGWWATLLLPKARMHWQQPLDMSGSAQIKMKDVSLVLALFSGKRDFPGWIDRLINAGQAQVEGRVRWDGDTLIMAPLKANNQRFELEANLRLRGKSRQGRLFAKWGVLSMGMEVRDQQHTLHLVRARRWYDAQPPFRP